LPVKVLQRLPSARRERYIGEGGWDARERGFQRLSYADFFGYFLVRRQESNISPALQKSIRFYKPPLMYNAP